MTTLNDNILREIAPAVSGTKRLQQERVLQAIGAMLAETLAKFEVDNDLRRAHFLAQICHESDGFCTTEEYASGQAYEGRTDLGNTQPGDGPRYKGRGLIQLTGRANYQRYGDLLQIDLVGHPELAGDPATALVIACLFWKIRDLNPLADKDDIETITRRINGGLNGLASRRAFLARAKAALAGQEIISAAGMTLLHRGDKGEQVVALQSLLGARGFTVVADGDFGAATEIALRQFQARKGLPADGVVGPRTWEALAQTA
jgi:putative chitinase